MTAPITPDERAAMRALADAATPGPWEAHEGTVGAMTGPRGCGGCSGLVSPRHEPACFWSEVAGAAPADAAFIAAARAAVPRLLDALDTAEADRDEARAELAVARQHQREASLTIRSVEGLRKERDDALAEVARLRERQTSHDLANEAIRWKRRALDAEDALAARPAPVWDEDTVTEAVACELFMRGTGLDAEDFCEATEVIRGIWRQAADAVLYIAQRHLPVRPDSLAVIAAVRAEYGDVWDTPVPEVGKTVGWIIANATLPILDAWPGESRATVQAEALRDAIEHVDEASVDAYCANGVVTWLRARADRLTGEGGQQ